MAKSAATAGRDRKWPVERRHCRQRPEVAVRAPPLLAEAEGEAGRRHCRQGRKQKQGAAITVWPLRE